MAAEGLTMTGYFPSMPKAQKQMFIVGARSRSGVPAKLVIGTPPAIHADGPSAIQEAQRLAAANTDKEFFVFRAVAVVSCEPPPPLPVTVTEL